MQRPVRTRFAPSPTGYLHVGGARTALFSWLYARHFGGTFILRIEDTDLERSTDASIQAILEGMAWLGLEYDEGPFYQTKRFDRYREVAQQLLAEGKAYRCYCSKERLEALRTEQEATKQKPRYDGHCLRHAPADANAPYVIRFRNPTEGDVSFDDQVRGTITFANSELDDLIIARSDGTPTYNFTVVVDDADMGITHVIRGDDHINNTPRQINILKALGVEVPIYAHLPMIVGSDGKRLSKRHGAVSVMQYQTLGVLPEALLNYLVRLGWSAGDKEIFSRQEMIELFNLGAVHRSAAAFDTEKLLWLNQHYLKTLNPLTIAPLLADQLAQLGLVDTTGVSLEAVVKLQAERVKTLSEMAERSRYFFVDMPEYDPVAVEKNLTAEVLAPFVALQQRLEQLSDWRPAAIYEALVAVAEQAGLKLGKVAQPLRVAMTGGTVSPSIDATVWVIGKRRALQRLTWAIQQLSAA